MHIIARMLRRWLRRPHDPAVQHRLPDLTPRQLDLIRANDRARRNWRTGR